jgi:NAD-dependent dihydropyrimidine dehydrogenase PreA subunit
MTVRFFGGWEFKSADARLPEWKGRKFTLQVAAEDCTGCGICFYTCPEPGALTVSKIQREKAVA